MSDLGRMKLIVPELNYHWQCCRDCRWWLTQTAAEAEQARKGTFGSTRVQALSTSSDEIVSEGRGICLLTEASGGEPKHRESLAQVWDGDHYSAMLVTAPDFGCVQFEAKEG